MRPVTVHGTYGPNDPQLRRVVSASRLRKPQVPSTIDQFQAGRRSWTRSKSLDQSNIPDLELDPNHWPYPGPLLLLLLLLLLLGLLLVQLLVLLLVRLLALLPPPPLLLLLLLLLLRLYYIFCKDPTLLLYKMLGPNIDSII